MFEFFEDEDGDVAYEINGWHLKAMNNSAPFLGYDDASDMVIMLLADGAFHEGLSWDETAAQILKVALAVFN